MSNASNSVSNIGPRESQNRIIIGLLMAVIAIGLIVLLFVLNWSSLWGVLVFFPLTGAFLGFLQAKNKTCIAMAAKSQHSLDSGVEKIEDEVLISKLKEQGNMIVTHSVLYAVVLTTLLIIVLEML